MTRVEQCLLLVLAAGALMGNSAVHGQAREAAPVLAAAREALGGEAEPVGA